MILKIKNPIMNVGTGNLDFLEVEVVLFKFSLLINE